MSTVISVRFAALILPALLAAATPALADDRPVTLIQLWQDASSDCRGYPGDDPRSVKGCAERDLYGRKLAAVGWCYGRRGELGYQMQWHRCGPNSIRPGT
jgi:hypothetical protein